jgi:hypothetical protein
MKYKNKIKWEMGDVCFKEMAEIFSAALTTQSAQKQEIKDIFEFL